MSAWAPVRGVVRRFFWLRREFRLPTRWVDCTNCGGVGVIDNTTGRGATYFTGNARTCLPCQGHGKRRVVIEPPRPSQRTGQPR